MRNFIAAFPRVKERDFACKALLNTIANARIQDGHVRLMTKGKTVKAKALIEHYQLIKHPEGGYYRETYRSDGVMPHSALPEEFSGSRHFSTAIVFLLEKGQYSHLHRIHSDEIWHFYLGGPLRLAMVYPDGEMEEIILGQDIEAGQHLQYVVASGVWFGATPCEGSEFSFVGCTVSPGFDFADFEMGEKQALKKAWPKAQSCIEEFGM